MKTLDKKSNVTIKTVAKDAGVSVSAVSKVLRNAYGVSDAMKQRVEESIASLGYRPKAAARGLRGRTFTIGVLATDISNPFISQLLDGISESTDDSGFRFMIGAGRANAPIELDLVESMVDFKMDGIILIAPHLSPEIVESFAAQIPTVCIGYHQPQAETFDTINGDDFLGAQLAIRHFLESGCKRISMITLEPFDGFETTVVHLRQQGYRECMSAAGLDKNIELFEVGPVDGVSQSRIDQFVSSEELPEAVFCWSDIDAIHLLDALYKEGIDVPNRVSVVGYDNSSIAALPQLSLSSIDQNGVELGRIAAEVLFERIEGRKTSRHELIEPHLVIRNSSTVNPN